MSLVSIINELTVSSMEKSIEFYKNIFISYLYMLYN